MPVGFKINNTEFETEYVRREFFQEGNLWAWGVNGQGQLGDNTSTNRSSPVQTVAGGTNWKEISQNNGNGLNPAAAIKTDGTLWTWGYNNSGQLGDNTTITKSSPVQTVAGGTNWKQVSTGHIACGAIKTDGTLWMWGFNSNGELGDNTRTNRSSPIQTIASGNNWKQLSFGYTTAGAIKTDGTLWTWGNNYYGALGDNTRTDKSSPVQTVAGGTNWKQVSAGIQCVSGIKTDGTLWTWGYNNIGQLGDNTRTDKSSPVQTVAGGTNWKQVSTGNAGSLTSMIGGIKTDGTLWTWGRNNLGQLGDNTTSSKSSPVQTIAGGTNWKQVSTGYTYILCIKTDGTLWTWGRNDYGQLGDNTITNRSSPIQTIAGGTNWKQVSSGGYHIMAIRHIS